ncbi:GHMP kinase [Salmonella enterica subsp. enterica]|uniref:GHMP kinase n=1 Tax=Salmonella enterica I TaxID=59201 RepID=A0A3S4LUS8_SALET|nr:GHMP kinase [Salmonella enterica subsp. enterica]
MKPPLHSFASQSNPLISTVFHQLTLFDHNNAATQIACEPPPPIDLLVLESPVTLRTQDYHRLPRQQKLIASSATLQQAWNLVQEACITQNPLRLGEAATLSAIASQTLLPKPGFTALLSLVEECDLYGLNVAHSGSVVGLMLDRKRHDIARLKGKLAEKKTYPTLAKTNIYSRWSLAGSNCSESLIYAPTAVAHYSAFTSACFHFAHRFQLFGNVATLFGDFGIFNDVVINAIFIVAFHTGDDTLNRLNAHTWLDVVAQVVQQQHTLLVVTDLLLNVLNFTLQFIFATEQTNKLQHVLERRLGCFHFYTPDNVRFGFVKQTASG